MIMAKNGISTSRSTSKVYINGCRPLIRFVDLDVDLFTNLLGYLSLINIYFIIIYRILIRSTRSTSKNRKKIILCVPTHFIKNHEKSRYTEDLKFIENGVDLVDLVDL